MAKSTETPGVKMLQVIANKAERLQPTNVSFWRSPLGVLRSMLGPESRAVREYQRLIDGYDLSEPSSFRSSAIALLRTLISNLEAIPIGGVPVTSVGRVFLGHGRSSLEWMSVERLLRIEHGLDVEAFETETRTSQHIVDVLKTMLDRCSMAVIVCTAEDLTNEGVARARQNVIHEAGLFQGRLGFERVILIEQDGIEEPSNLAGLLTIRFHSKVEESFYELGRVLRKIKEMSG